MPQPTTIHLKSPVDLIVSLPYQLGFQPRRSVVLVCLQGNRLGLVMRLDIPPLKQTKDAARALVEPMVQQHPSSVVLLGYEDHMGESEPILNALKRAISWTDVELDDVLVVRDERWYHPDSLQCQECPIEGTPLTENVSVTSEFVAMGKNPLANREDVAARLEAHSHPIAACSAGVTPEAIDAWVKTLTTGNTTLMEVSAAAGALADIDFRDAMIAHLLPGVLNEALISPQMQDIFSLFPPIVAEGAIDRLIEMCADLSDASAAPSLTLLANYTWFLGDGALTRMALDRALRCDPTYRLALLLERMVELAIRPIRQVS